MLTDSVSGGNDITRFYDGNKREIKRRTTKYDDTSGTWIEKSVKYYVRSSVLGGETVSEVWANGKKAKTFVRAAGAKIAYQSAYYSPTSALSQAVLFQFTDASGMSSRTTNKDGADVASGDGGDGSPVETDPLGGNVGTSDPYIQLNPYSPKPEYPMLQPWGDESTQYINGQQVSVELDGIAISFATARSLQRSGAAISTDLALHMKDPKFRYEEVGLGLFRESYKG